MSETRLEGFSMASDRAWSRWRRNDLDEFVELVVDVDVDVRQTLRGTD